MALDNTFDFGDAVATGNEPLIAQQIRIAQQKKQLQDDMAAAAGQGTPQGQMVSGHYVKPSLGQQLTPLLGQALNQYRQMALDTQSSDLDRKVATAKAQVLSQAPGADATPQDRMAFVSRLQQIPGMSDLANVAAKDYLISEPDRAAARADAKDIKLQQIAAQRQTVADKIADTKRHDADTIADRQQRAADANDLRATLAAAVRGAGAGADKASNYQVFQDANGNLTRVNKLTGESSAIGSGGREAASITKDRQTQGESIANAQKGLSLTAEARTLLPQATGSAAGSLRDTIAGAAGYATDGAKASARLDSIAATLASQVPRLGGSTSDADLKFYKEQVGNLGDRSKPVQTRMAALEQVEKAFRRASNPASYASPQGTPPADTTAGPSIRDAVESAAKQHSNTGKVRTFNPATGMLE